MPDRLIAPGIGPLVVKLGGAAVDDPDGQRDLFSSLARIHEAHEAGLATLAYLLEMTAMEATEASLQRNPRRRATTRVH